MAAIEPQLVAAVALPVLVGLIETPAATVTAGGQLIVGGLVLAKVMLCTHGSIAAFVGGDPRARNARQPGATWRQRGVPVADGLAVVPQESIAVAWPVKEGPSNHAALQDSISGQAITGGSGNVRVTTNEHVLVFPLLSTAIAMMRLVPGRRMLLLVGNSVSVTGEQLSTATGDIVNGPARE